jgi:hypothetical protein
MKKQLSFRGVFAALLCVGTIPLTSQAAVVVDPSFEIAQDDVTNPWARFGNAFIGDAGSPSRSGNPNSSAKLFGNFSGGQNFTGVFQDVAVDGTDFSVGDQIQLSGFAQNLSTDPLPPSSTNEAFIEITWFDPGGLGEFGFGSNVSQIVTGGSAQDVWISLNSPTAIIPVEADFIRVKAVYIQQAGSFDGGAVFFYDLSLTAIPEPSSIAFLALGSIACFTGSRRRRN